MDVERLVKEAKRGNNQSLARLLEECKSLVRSKVTFFVPPGLERDDLLQEGMIGLFKAISSYRVEEASSFLSFASICIERQVISAIRKATRKKHSPLNSSVSLDWHPLTNGDLVDDIGTANPLSLMIAEEDFIQTKDSFNASLTPLEAQVFNLKMAGVSYKNISLKLDITEKSVDNALQRAKDKFKQCWQ